MDCDQVGELLDAYALGAAEADEAAALEEHVADCVRCWSSLNEAQQAAATIALSTAFQRAPASLRKRILAETERGERRGVPELLQFVRGLWPVGAGVVTAAAAACVTKRPPRRSKNGKSRPEKVMTRRSTPSWPSRHVLSAPPWRSSPRSSARSSS